MAKPAPDQPGPADKKLWFWPWNFHWTFLHTCALFPHEAVPNAPHRVRPLAQAPRRIQQLSFTGADGKTKRLTDLLDRKDTDGFMVLHHGKVAFERLHDDMSATTNHWTLSLCRTFPALIAGKLVEQGRLDMNKPVETVIPELKHTGFAGVTLRQLLDMRSGVTSTNILKIMWADGFFPNGPLPPPAGIKEHILSRKSRDREHGGTFKYRCLDSEIIGWLCERASGKRLPQLISEMIWRPIGAEQPAQFLLDRAGDPTYESGLCANIHDLARFGLLLAEDDKRAKPILARGWMHDTRTGDAGTRKAFGGKFFGVPLPNGMYRNHMWVVDADRGCTLCYGAFGQMVYVDPTHDMVCVLLSSCTRPQDPVTADWLKAFDVIGQHLDSPAP